MNRRKADAIKVKVQVTAGNLSQICVYKPIIIQTPVATFNKDLKRLVLVGDPCLVNGEDIPEVPRDCVPLSKTKMVGENVQTPPKYGPGNKIKKKDLLEGLTLPPPRLYQVSINVFIQGLSKIAAPRTTHP